MNLTKTTGYAIHALSFLEQANGQSCFVRDIAAGTGIKKPYLARIINQLVHHKFVAAKRGYRGGVTLAVPTEQISLLQIVKAIEGEAWIRPCFFALDDCPGKRGGPVRRYCPAHSIWVEMQGRIESVLRDTTLAEVTKCIRPEATEANRTPELTVSLPPNSPPMVTVALPTAAPEAVPA
jgi:Rrf2 family transcriptional regulator, iron-sulfur cluster assembly transcription factor